MRTGAATVANLFLPAGAFKTWSLSVFTGLLAYDWLRVLIWFDHMGLRVATLVNLTFIGGDRLDEVAARFTGHAGRTRVIPEGVRRFATWAPLLIPFYIPHGPDWDRAWTGAEAIGRIHSAGVGPGVEHRLHLSAGGRRRRPRLPGRVARLERPARLRRPVAARRAARDAERREDVPARQRAAHHRDRRRRPRLHRRHRHGALEPCDRHHPPAARPARPARSLRDPARCRGRRALEPRLRADAPRRPGLPRRPAGPLHHRAAQLLGRHLGRGLGEPGGRRAARIYARRADQHGRPPAPSRAHELPRTRRARARRLSARPGFQRAPRGKLVRRRARRRGWPATGCCAPPPPTACRTRPCSTPPRFGDGCAARRLRGFAHALHRPRRACATRAASDPRAGARSTTRVRSTPSTPPPP